MSEQQARASRSSRMHLRAGAVRAGSAVTASDPDSWAQMIKTTLAVLVWLGATPVFIALIATYDGYRSAQAMTIGLAIGTGIACHLWPPRTAPWRTVLWAMLLCSFLGSALLTLGAGRLSLSLVTAFGFGFVALRLNQNGRRAVDLIQMWRSLR